MSKPNTRSVGRATTVRPTDAAPLATASSTRDDSRASTTNTAASTGMRQAPSSSTRPVPGEFPGTPAASARSPRPPGVLSEVATTSRLPRSDFGRDDELRSESGRSCRNPSLPGSLDPYDKFAPIWEGRSPRMPWNYGAGEPSLTQGARDEGGLLPPRVQRVPSDVGDGESSLTSLGRTISPPEPPKEEGPNRSTKGKERESSPQDSVLPAALRRELMEMIRSVVREEQEERRSRSSVSRSTRRSGREVTPAPREPSPSQPRTVDPVLRAAEDEVHRPWDVDEASGDYRRREAAQRRLSAVDGPADGTR